MNGVPKRRGETYGICDFLLIIFALIWIFPLFAVLWLSITHQQDSSTAFFTVENYRRIFTTYKFHDALLNTLKIAVPSTLIPVLIGAISAYGFAWVRFRARKFIFGFILALLMIPFQSIALPLYLYFSSSVFNETFVSIYLLHIAFSLPVSVYVLYNYISRIPYSVLESAFIDGVSHFSCFTKIVFPLSWPAILSFAVFQLMWVCNSLLIPLVFLREKNLLTTRLLHLWVHEGGDIHLIAAGVIVTVILPLLTFTFLRRHLDRTIMGSV